MVSCVATSQLNVVNSSNSTDMNTGHINVKVEEDAMTTGHSNVTVQEGARDYDPVLEYSPLFSVPRTNLRELVNRNHLQPVLTCAMP